MLDTKYTLHPTGASSVGKGAEDQQQTSLRGHDHHPKRRGQPGFCQYMELSKAIQIMFLRDLAKR